MTRLPKDVQAALDRLEPRLAAAIIEAFQNMTDAVAVQQVEVAIVSGNIEAAVNLLRISPEWFTPVHEALRAAMIEGGGIAAASIRIRDPYDGSRFVMGFDGRHVRAERWISEQSSRLISDVIEDQKEMARTAIRAGLERGRHPRTVALDIVGRVNRATGQRAGGYIGLDSQRQRIADIVLEGMKTPEGVRSLVTAHRDGRVSLKYRSVNKATANRIIAAYRRGDSVAPADIAISRRQLINKLMKDRADTIARTEQITAMRAGQIEGFAQLVDSGKVRDDQIVKGWSATMDTRTRPDHVEMDGKTVRGINTPFVMPDESKGQYPGDPALPGKHSINCRCWMEIRVRSDLMRYEDD